MTTTPLDWIALGDAAPLRSGKERLVFAHPDDPEKLVKVHDDRRPVLSQRGPRGVLTRRLPSVRYRFQQREMNAWLDLVLSGRAHAQDLPIPVIHGFALTDRGPALVVERICQSNGKLGGRFRRLAENGISPALVDQLNDLVMRIDETRVPVSDFNPGNLVQGTRDGTTRLYLVDGFGDYRTIRWLGSADWHRRWRFARACRAFAARYDLHWDGARRMFALSPG